MELIDENAMIQCYEIVERRRKNPDDASMQ